MGEKFIGYFHLIDACRHPGCPMCRCLEEDSRRRLTTLLYEHVTDPETRRRLRASWGLCNWHTWMVLDAGGATGLAIIYEDLIRVCRQRVDRLRDRVPSTGIRFLGWLGGILGDMPRRVLPRLVQRYRERARCVVCAELRRSEATYIATVLDFANDPEFDGAYRRSSGLCLPHVMIAHSHNGRRSAAISSASSPSTSTGTPSPSMRMRPMHAAGHSKHWQAAAECSGRISAEAPPASPAPGERPDAGGRDRHQRPGLAGPAGVTMRKIEGEQVLMRIFVGESDQWEHHPLYMSLLQLFRTEGLAGATVLRGIAGFGPDSVIHTANLFRLSSDLPVIIEVVDSEERLRAVLPEVDRRMSGGLITMERVRVVRYANGASQ
jgi:hypothetical protein